MDIRYAWHPDDVKHYTTKQLRENFLIQDLFIAGEIRMTYSHVDRIITAGICPADQPLTLTAGKEMGVDYFLQRRELGIINIGGEGSVTLDGEVYRLSNRDGIYVGMGTENVSFESADPSQPAKFYMNSTPAHMRYPTVKIDFTMANPRPLGTPEECNQRTIYQYVHPSILQSCQLLMGMTELEPGSIWNTMPCHTHDRRMEVYFYFDLGPEDTVFHFMGEPQETRHLTIHNEQAVICPSWSVHFGCGTRNYTFIWGMAGENQEFDDMDTLSPIMLS